MGLSPRPAREARKVAEPDVRWLEVWTDDDGYLLVLKSKASGAFEVFDPQTKAVDSTWTTYAAAENELAQDEFHRVEGRQQF